MTVTRVAYCSRLNAGKYAQLVEQAGRLRLVNAAYTSQVIPGTSLLGRRAGDRLHSPHGRVVWHADHAAAINILDRDADPDIGPHTPHWRVEQIIQERADRHRSGLPDQDSNTTDTCRCGERTIRPRSALIKV